MAAITDRGFIRPTYEELYNAQVERAKVLFGDDIDTDTNTPLGKYIEITVNDIEEAYKILENCYYSRFPQTASGVALDRLCTFVGISRNSATAARHKVKFTGNGGYTIPGGTLVRTVEDIEFFTENEVTIEANTGLAEATVQCTQNGTVGNVKLGSINSLVINISPNVSGVEHIEILDFGQEEESDTELRERFTQTVSIQGSGTINSIAAAVLAVPNVSSVLIKENNTAESVDSLPPHSFEVFVVAPTSQNQEIAKAIFSKKPIGIKSVGDIACQVTDYSGTEHTIYFSRTQETQIYVSIRIKVNNLFETSGQSEIAEKISQKINSLSNGEDVILSSLYGCIYSVNGVCEVQELKLSTDGITYITNNINIADNQIARSSINCINVEVVRP